MSDWGRAGFADEKFFQAVIDIVPGVIGLRGERRERDESQRQPQARMREKASIKTHSYIPSLFFAPTLS